MWHFSPEKRALFSLLKKWGGEAHSPLPPPPVSVAPGQTILLWWVNQLTLGDENSRYVIGNAD
jgi:hypothetical protein